MLGEKALRPADVVEQPDGSCRRPVTRYNPDGTTYLALLTVCERCWEPMPVYFDAPNGWVSPDSNRKLRTTMTDGRASIEAPQKVVCYECLKADHLDMFGVFADIPHDLKQR